MALNLWLRRSVVVLAAAIAVTGLLTGRSFSDDVDDEEEDKGAAKTLTITITADENGKVSSLKVGLAKLFDGPLDERKLTILNRRLKDVFAIEGIPFDQVLFRVDESLNAGDLIKVIQVCDKQKLPGGKALKKISFVTNRKE